MKLKSESENNVNLVSIISDRHSNDEMQLEFVFSSELRILVEAPAGYGKTRALISKVAYLIASQENLYPRKILVLTFSVNAAYKIKKEVAKELPELLTQLDANSRSLSVSERLFVSNYHGFCRSVLKKHGHVLNDVFRDFDLFESISDDQIENLTTEIPTLEYENAEFLSDFSKSVATVDYSSVKKHFNKYNTIILDKIIPHKKITYNGILSLTLHLFKKYPQILRFYEIYYPIVIVDEFQDTNLLSYALINRIVGENTALYLLGDSLQRIYGFIGAISGLLSKVEEKFNMKKVILNKNYRFKDNIEMLNLDRNIRLNAENLSNPSIVDEAVINLSILEDQQEEAERLIEIVNELLIDPNKKVAVLFRGRGNNTQTILEYFDKIGIDYFYALFTDEDRDYINFHKQCLRIFNKFIAKEKRISRKLINKLLKEVRGALYSEGSQIIVSLFSLLEVFFKRIDVEYKFLNNDEKIDLIKENFENNALKQNIEYLPSKLTVATVHAAKGLEWDYVLMPDLEQFAFPSYMSLCSTCLGIDRTCDISRSRTLEVKFLEELSVFYVGVTRARNNVYMTASKRRFNFRGVEQDTNISCFVNLSGIVY